MMGAGFGSPGNGYEGYGYAAGRGHGGGHCNDHGGGLDIGDALILTQMMNNNNNNNNGNMNQYPMNQYPTPYHQPYPPQLNYGY